MTLSISAVLWRQMHSHGVSDTEQDVCACLYSLPVISILAAGDKAQWHSVRLRLALRQGTSGQSIHTSNTTVVASVSEESATIFLLHYHYLTHYTTVTPLLYIVVYSAGKPLNQSSRSVIPKQGYATGVAGGYEERL